MVLPDRIERLIGQGLTERNLRVAILDLVRTAVPFDSFVWLLTDPVSCVGCLPLADVPDLREIPTLIRLRYASAENRWSDSAASTVSTLVEATSANLARSSLWREGLAAHRVSDIATTVLRDQYGCWGFIDLWRTNGAAFSPSECSVLADCAPTMTTAVRRSLLSTFERPTTPFENDDGPAIVLLDDDLTLLIQTAQADAYLRALLPAPGDHPPVPAAVYNVGAQLLAQEQGLDAHQARARLPLGGRWLTARAARTERATAAHPSIAVSIQLASPAERADLYARVAGLSDREREVLDLVVNGLDTRSLADRLFISQHTVQDHLKSIFAKTGLRNRKALIARATGAA